MAFLGGITGTMLRQFAVTIVIAVVLSGIVALTLTPALCAMLLKETPHDTHNPLLPPVQPRVRPDHRRLRRPVGAVLGRPRTWLAGFGVILALAFVLYRRVPAAFVPTEDKGFFVIAIQLPDAASRQRTDAVVERVEGMLRKEPGVRTFAALVGFDLLAQSNQTNGATMFARLKPWDERNKDKTVDAILGRLNGQLFGLKDAVAFGFNFPEIPGLGTTAGLELNLQARQARTSRPSPVRCSALADMNKLPETPGAATPVRANVPQVFVRWIGTRRRPAA